MQPFESLGESTFAPQGDTNSAGAPSNVTPGPSPFRYVATYRQALHVTGGSISTITYARGAVLLSLALLTGGQLIELNAGDAVTITYLTTPTLTVIPR